MRAKISLVRLKMVSWVKPEEHPFRISTLELCLSVIMALGILIPNCSVLQGKRIPA